MDDNMLNLKIDMVSFCCQSLSLILVMDDSMLKLKIGPYLGWLIFFCKSCQISSNGYHQDD